MSTVAELVCARARQLKYRAITIQKEMKYVNTQENKYVYIIYIYIEEC